METGGVFTFTSLLQGVNAVPRAFLYLGPVTLFSDSSDDLQRWCGRIIET
jgi:hypothetical protein